MQKTRSADFFADRIDVTNLAVITNVVMKRVHCTVLMHGFSASLRMQRRAMLYPRRRSQSMRELD